jgi:two-component system chemotaxis response regulator CheY
MTAGPGTLCVVDDDADIREVLSDVLTFAGYEVILADDGQSALDRLRARKNGCRLILLDLMMPRMNGWEFRRRQLADPALASIPVMLLTGAGTAAKAIDELRVDATIEKPFDLDTLLASVAHYCDGAK